MLRVNALQSIKIFGLWDQPRNIVDWNDIKHLKWHELRVEYNFTAEELYLLQPNKHEWLKRGQLALCDLPEMTIFPVNPYEDLNADLSEVWSMQWDLDMWCKMQITYAQMRKCWLTASIMRVMGLELSDWAKLQMSADDVTDEIAAIFGMPASECRQILVDYK